MPTHIEQFAVLETDYRKHRRALIFHGIFVLLCLIIAMAVRRALNYPPVLTWLVTVVPFLVFSTDIFRFLRARHRLARFLAQHAPAKS